MVATGLSETPAAYRAKLAAQDDAQLDAWVASSLRDIAKRRGVVDRKSTRLNSSHMSESRMPSSA